MLVGQGVRLRPIQENDLQYLYERHTDIDDRGPYFPIGVMSMPRFLRQYQESGFWTDDEGMLVIVGEAERILGHIEFYPTVRYLDELELSYHIYGSEHRGKGIASEAVRLMAAYLFQRKKVNRIRLMIHPANKASLRVAEKAGFERESIARGIWFNRGRSEDLVVCAALRDEFLRVPSPEARSSEHPGASASDRA
jgi:RimJ/RimL family protein N-acetyltransferase